MQFKVHSTDDNNIPIDMKFGTNPWFTASEQTVRRMSQTTISQISDPYIKHVTLSSFSVSSFLSVNLCDIIGRRDKTGTFASEAFMYVSHFYRFKVKPRCGSNTVIRPALNLTLYTLCAAFTSDVLPDTTCIYFNTHTHAFCLLCLGKLVSDEFLQDGRWIIS